MHLTCCGRMTVSVGHHTRSVGLSFVCNSQTSSEWEAVDEVSFTMPGISHHARDKRHRHMQRHGYRQSFIYGQRDFGPFVIVKPRQNRKRWVDQRYHARD